ncbi:hypothetical protein [Methylobacterium sp. 22177]|uniref:hypothetical protein n=1 Tax=Methylobacterium sp. 22177 TaxID=3453885 RepID=UPI003F84C211
MQVPDISIFGSIIHLDNQFAIVQIPMIGSCAVPLEIRYPKAVDLFAWSFTGFSGQKITDPGCILFLASQNTDGFSDLSSVSLRTHTGDRHVILNPIYAPVSYDKISIAAMAFVSALGSKSVPKFDALMPILKPGLDAILTKTESNDLDIRRGYSADTWLVNKIDFVPDCMILRSPAGYACSSLSAVRFQASRQAAVALTTAIPLNAHRADGAILSGNGRYAAARVIGAM